MRSLYVRISLETDVMSFEIYSNHYPTYFHEAATKKDRDKKRGKLC